MMKSLFKSAQNITARNKTHVTANAYEVFDFLPTSVFAQDWVYNSEKYPDLDNPVLEGYEPKDRCYRRAVVVIRPMNTETQQYLFGEVEANESFYDTYVWEDRTVIDNFDKFAIPKDGTIVHVTTHKDENDFITEEKSIVIGYAEEGEVDRPIALKNVKAVKFIKEQITSGPLGKSKVTLRVARKAGNARCDSNTGFKGVTKGKPYLGRIVMADGTELTPDFAFGMNSFKAKHNGIQLARAALAVDLKAFTPDHWSGLLNTNDEDEVNAASNALPSYTYYDEFGEVHSEVQVGVIYYRYTELGDIFKSFRPQSLSHETGRNLYHNENPELFHYLWDNYVNGEMKEALIEFQKVLCSAGDFEGDVDKPHYTIATIRKSKLFDLEKDLITSTMLNSHSKTKLTQDEFNPNGFFLDFRPNRGPLVRVPSAKILRMFEQELETGAWMYHAMFISLSKIIRACIYGNPQFIFQKTSEKVKRDTLADRYLRDVRGIIFTTDESAEMNVTALSRPMVPGIAMKQVVDVLLPEGTALIMCKKTYNKALRNCFGDDYELESLKYGFQGFHVRNPSLWRTQMKPVKLWSADDFRVYLMSKFNISLDKYLLTHENHDVIIFSKDVFQAEHSDADGDPLQVLNFTPPANGVMNLFTDGSFTVTLTIESANGANIGSSNTCNVTIENVMAVQYGQYTFKTSNGSPSEWTLILREGANGTYIMENMFDVSDSPKLIGEFDAENMQMTFDGRVNGFGDANYNGKIGWGQRGSDYLAFQCSSPMVFTVNENMELEGTNAQFFFLLLIMDETGSAITKQETLASFNGGVCTFEGEISGDTEWPF